MTEQPNIYRLLENHFLTYRELASVPVEDCGEAMVPIGPEFSGKVLVVDEQMKAYTGDRIYVREALVDRLEKAQQTLKTVMPDCDLQVVYGYRHLNIQTFKFESYKKTVLERQPELEGVELNETVHRFSAVPEVAGHPTGGAVDLHIVDASGKPLPFGTPIHKYDDDTYVFSPFIDRESARNRQILRYCMQVAGFAPFDGEWWHFSYGDREWAFYYSQPKAIYSQLNFSSVETAA
ncbi:D-alanyl-D-alanine dipeptidase [Mesorhizobium sp. J18]|uniref:M15 family metallopeptidase n=1 Tax=Mesorhizobium sp. J18 TaxID=935263 RepID=UPI00119B383D|nr:M15 family metallopeptidase [Mesorhizobium sp. J18]TWG92359.1 D-alanyl-D-alanine dipeptidase [Mesorhizobium sp. J18]